MAKMTHFVSKCSNTHKTLKTCNISKYFRQTPQLVVKLIYSFNQSLHDGQQNTAINMKYDTLQTQMDTGKNATKGNLWVEIPLKKKNNNNNNIYIYIYIYIYIFYLSHLQFFSIA